MPAIFPGSPALRMPFAGGIRSKQSMIPVVKKALSLWPSGRRVSSSLAVALLDEVVHQLAGAVVHLDVERFNLAGEVVERHNGGDGDQKAERRRHQGLRDTARDCADTRGLLRGDLLEGVQNTDHRAEQADEGRRR